MKRNQIKSAIDNKQETKYECAKGVTKNLRTAYFFKSGGCPDLLMVPTPANSLQQDLETSDERHESLEKLCKKRAREKERSGLYLFPPSFTFPSTIVKP